MKTGILISPMSHSNQTREGEQFYIPVIFYKNNESVGVKLLSENRDSTQLQELSLMNKTFVGVIQYDVYLDMKLGHTIKRIFEEMSSIELETKQHLSELEQTQLLQPLASAVLRRLFVGYQITHPRKNRTLTKPGVQFNISPSHRYFD